MSDRAGAFRWEVGQVKTYGPQDLPGLVKRVARLERAIEAHKTATETGLLGKAEQDAADRALWALLDEL